MIYSMVYILEELLKNTQGFPTGSPRWKTNGTIVRAFRAIIRIINCAYSLFALELKTV